MKITFVLLLTCALGLSACGRKAPPESPEAEKPKTEATGGY